MKKYQKCLSLTLLLALCCLPSCSKDDAIEPKTEVKKADEQPKEEENPTQPSTPDPLSPPPTPEPTPPAPESPTTPPTSPYRVYSKAELENYVYELPLVFHIITGREDQHKISQIDVAYVEKQIEEANKIYAGEHGGANSLVKFYLAKDVPSGKRTDLKGIVRHTTTQKNINYETVLYDKKGGEYFDMRWDTRQYVNVYIFNFHTPNYAGVSIRPYVVHQHPLPGLLNYPGLYVEDQINPAVCIDLGSFLEDGQNTVGQVLAHELGHYLGLVHVFVNAKDSDDYCDDTPNYNRDTYLAGVPGLIDLVNANRHDPKRYRELYLDLYYRTSYPEGKRFLSDNVMDYYFSFYNKLTKNQVERIRHSLYYAPMLPGPKAIDLGGLRSASIMPGAFELPHINVCN